MSVEPGAAWKRALWILVAWPAPAIIAGLSGWNGIWGSGSAFYDYLIPIPVAGGALHVPSFVVATAFVFSLGSATPGAADRRRRLAPLLLGLALAGALFLVDLERIFRALTTDAPFRLRFERNALALFVTTDATLAFLFTNGVRFSPRLAAAIAAPVAVGGLAFGMISLSQPEIGHGIARYGKARGDQMRWAHAPAESLRTFEDRAFQYAQAFHPNRNVNAEDLAIYFTSSAAAASEGGDEGIFATLCLYEDGTGPVWAEERIDCFSHVSFSDRRASGRFDLDAFCETFESPSETRPGGRADVEACGDRAPSSADRQIGPTD